MIVILILFDLQNALLDVELGAFYGTEFLMPCNKTSRLTIAKIEDVRTIFISNRVTDSDGLAIYTTAFEKCAPGDRVTITGRISENTPIGGWCFELHRCRADGSGRAVQQFFPRRNRMYSLSYVLDKKDTERHMRVVSNPRILGIKPADFYIDDILITRNLRDNIDTRSVVYTMENDQFLKELNGGGYTEYLFASGDPLYTITERDKNNENSSIGVSRRVNDWDGIDIRVHLMNLLRGNKYSVRVSGRVDGKAPMNAEMVLQLLPSYSWCKTQRVSSYQYFTLEHTFSPDELEMLESVRITTNSAGARMSFFIHEIKIRRE